MTTISPSVAGFRIRKRSFGRLFVPVAALTLAASLVSAAPSFGATRHTVANAAAFPVTVPGDAGAVKLQTEPKRIVSLSPTATEILFAVGAGKQVVAVDADSDYPKSAPKTALSGLSPNVEAIAKYRPDLVVVSYLPAGGSFTKGLAALHIPVLVQDAATKLAATYQQIVNLGEATGHTVASKHLVSTMKREIAAAVKGAPKSSASSSYYFELDQTGFSVTSSTYIGQVLGLFHLRNIADTATGAASSGGYPQLSSEYVVKSNPSLIFLADTLCCHQSAATVAKRPGFASLSAVKHHGVIGLNDDIASRWGPRVVDLAQAVEDALSTLHK